jgi:hypothetical protein
MPDSDGVMAADVEHGGEGDWAGSRRSISKRDTLLHDVMRTSLLCDLPSTGAFGGSTPPLAVAAAARGRVPKLTRDPNHCVCYFITCRLHE